MWNTNISSRVKKVIAQRVKDAQAEHDQKEIDLEKQKQEMLEAHADEMVQRVIGK